MRRPPTSTATLRRFATDSARLSHHRRRVRHHPGGSRGALSCLAPPHLRDHHRGRVPSNCRRRRPDRARRRWPLRRLRANPGMRGCRHGHQMVRRLHTSAMSTARCAFTRQRSSPVSAQITQAAYDCRYPFWSPDGKRLYFISLARDRESLWSISAAGALPRSSLKTSIGPPSRPTPGRLRFFGTSAGGLSLARPRSGSGPRAAAKRRHRIPRPTLRWARATFSPDGRTLALSAIPRTIDVPPDARGWQLWVLPTSNGHPYRRLQSLSDVVPRVTNLAWMPDSRHLVLSLRSIGMESHLWMADLERDRA